MNGGLLRFPVMAACMVYNRPVRTVSQVLYGTGL